MKSKALEKGLVQLAEEGTTQVFRPQMGSDWIVGAVGLLQFDVVMHRLEHEYGVKAAYEPVSYVTARWVTGERKKLEEFEKREAMISIGTAKGISPTWRGASGGLTIPWKAGRTWSSTPRGSIARFYPETPDKYYALTDGRRHSGTYSRVPSAMPSR